MSSEPQSTVTCDASSRFQTSQEELFHYGGAHHTVRFRSQLLSFPFSEQIDQIDRFQARPSDVIVCTLPRSGTTWTLQLVYSLLHHSEDPAQWPLLAERCPFLEDGDNAVHAQQLADPRTIKTHLSLEALPPSIAASSCKIIYVARNPKDFAVSYLHFLRRLTHIYSIPQGFHLHHWLQCVREGRFCCGPLFEHVLPAWRRRNEERFLFLTYEQLSKNGLETLKVMSKFLELEIDEGKLMEIGERCSFAGMSVDEQVLGGNSVAGRAALLRTGRVGSWKEEFGALPEGEAREEVEKFEKWIDDSLSGTGLEFEYE